MYLTADGIQLRLSNAATNWLPNHTGAKVVYGTANNDVFYAVSGDTMLGGGGDDQYYIWSNNYTLTENVNGGVDTLYSNVVGVTTLNANVENLILQGSGSTYGVGNALNNIIIAGPSGAFIDGGAGNDVLVGGAGKDTFQISAGNGSDAIENFVSGSDTIRLQGYAVSSFSDLMSHATQVGSDVRFSFSNNETLVIRNTTLGTLKATDFQLPLDMSKMSLSFADDFSSLKLKADGGVWAPYYSFAGVKNAHGFASESQVYVDPSYGGTAGKPLGLNPFSVNNGVLSITAAPTPTEDLAYLGNKPFTSGVLSSEGTFSQQYGYFEVRAALPQGQGFWPAFWLLPENLKGGELDVFESLGGDAGQLYLSSHTLVNGTDTVNTGNFRVFDPTQFHTYGLNWTKDTLTWYVDGTAVLTQKTPDLLNQNGEFFINLNLAMGGWAGTPTAGSTGTMQVDYVHVYANSDTVSRTINGVHEVFGASTVPPVSNGQQPLTINGTAGDDNLLGNTADNTLIGGAGNDRLDGVAGSNTLIGGTGNDTYVVHATGDQVIENANEGIDTVLSDISYRLTDNVENLTLNGTAATSAIGNALDNVITGNAGANTIDGGAGADTMTGGAGNDLYYVDNAGDKVIEAAGSGRDTIIASTSYTLAAGQEVEVLRLAPGAGQLALNQVAQNAGKAWSVSTTSDGVTHFEVHAGDHWAGDGSDYSRERSELASGQELVTGQAYNINFSAKVEAGATNTASWLTIFQVQSNPDAGEAGRSPSFAIEMKGDQMRIVVRGSGVDAATDSNTTTTILYTDATDIVRDHWYDFSIQLKLDPSGNGIVNVVRDGQVLASYTGAVGFNDALGGYFKEGIYRSAAAETYAVDFKGMTLSTVGNGAAQDLNLTGNEFNNTLISNDGNNVLNGGAGADIMIGGKGNDTYYVDNAGDVVKEAAGEGNDTIITSVSYALAFGQSIETLQAAAGAVGITLTGNEMDNTLIGNAGPNILDGAAGADTLIGGAGNDSYIVSNSGDIVIERAGEGFDTVISSVSYALGAGQEIEQLQLAASTGTQALNLTGNDYANTLVGNDGNNVIDGGAGADTMIGGKGNDTYIVDNAADIIKEAVGGGTDTVLAKVSYSLALGQNIENLQAYDLNSTTPINLTGNELDNVITGNAGDNIIDGGPGADTMIGGKGNDSYIVDNAADKVIEAVGGGNDTVIAKVNYALGAGQEIETLQAAGGTANINLTGNEFGNSLVGNSGNNVLVGGAGRDMLYGGLGADTFVFNDGDTGNTDATADVIRDFYHAQGDKIDLHGIDANTLVAGDQAFTLHANGNDHVAGSLWLVQSGTTTLVNMDVDGDGKADYVIHVANPSAVPLVASDFVF